MYGRRRRPPLTSFGAGGAASSSFPRRGLFFITNARSTPDKGAIDAFTAAAWSSRARHPGPRLRAGPGVHSMLKQREHYAAGKIAARARRCRPATAEDIGPSAVYLASDDARSVAGVTLRSTGHYVVGHESAFYPDFLLFSAQAQDASRQAGGFIVPFPARRRPDALARLLGATHDLWGRSPTRTRRAQGNMAPPPPSQSAGRRLHADDGAQVRWSQPSTLRGEPATTPGRNSFPCRGTVWLYLGRHPSLPARCMMEWPRLPAIRQLAFASHRGPQMGGSFFV